MADKIKLPECVCLKCGWKWTPRIPDPRQYPNPNCHSIRWDEEKGNGDKGENNG